MPKYKLKSAYWDGAQMHPAGAVLEFEEGKAPKRSLALAPEVTDEELQVQKTAEEKAAAEKSLAATQAAQGPKAAPAKKA